MKGQVDELSVEEFERRLAHDYQWQLEAMDALLAFLAARPSIRAPATDLPTFVVGATFARAVKTFRGSLTLARTGYAEQSAMLNRSLFEDMALAYWIDEKGATAVEMLDRHHTLAADVYREALGQHGRSAEATGIEPLEVEERRALESEFGKHGSWFGRGGLHRVLKEIEHRWADEDERALLWRMYALAHRYNTLLLHHSANALNQNVARRADDQIAYSVGPSDRNVEGALLSAYYPLSQLGLLVFASDPEQPVLAAMVREALPSFIRLEPEVIEDTGRNDPCPCGSGKKFKKCHGK